jgi:hypothetical protein
MCLCCGHAGRTLQGDRGLTTFECPSCGEDLYARPPRSYAELEGLDDSIESSFTLSLTAEELEQTQPDPEPHRRVRHVERILVWGVVACVLLTLTGIVVGGL